MPFDATTYPFGEYAAVAPADRAGFEALKKDLVDELSPRDFLHALLVDEIVHASWELARARKYGAPQAFINRASRNWNRARKTLTRLNTSNLGALNLYEEPIATAAATCPLANPFKIDKPSEVRAAYSWIAALPMNNNPELVEQ